MNHPFETLQGEDLVSFEQTMSDLRDLIHAAPTTEVTKMYNMLTKLRSNREFRKLIEGVYLGSEAVKLVHLKASAPMHSPDRQARLDSQIMAIGHLNEFFNNIERAFLEQEANVETAREELALMESELNAAMQDDFEEA